MYKILLASILIVASTCSIASSPHSRMIRDLTIEINADYQMFRDTLIKEMRSCYDYEGEKKNRNKFCDNITSTIKDVLITREYNEINNIEEIASNVINGKTTYDDVVNSKSRMDNMKFIYTSIANARVDDTRSRQYEQAVFKRNNKPIEYACTSVISFIYSDCKVMGNKHFTVSNDGKGGVLFNRKDYRIEMDITGIDYIIPAEYSYSDGSYKYSDVNVESNTIVATTQGLYMNDKKYDNVSVNNKDIIRVNEQIGVFVRIDDIIVGYLPKGILSGIM